MNATSNPLMRVALGAAGGLVGTLALQSLLMGSQRWLPGALPPLREDPAEFMVRKAERILPRRARQRIPHAAEKVAGGTLAIGYGLTFGALYALLRPRSSSPWLEGLALGAVCWAAGYLGWLPAAGLMPPVWRHKAPQIFGPVAAHLGYGVAAAVTYHWVRQGVEGREIGPVRSTLRRESRRMALAGQQ